MNPYSRLAEMMEQRGAMLNDPSMTVAIVTSASPLQIKIGESIIGVNLYCNPALLLTRNPGAVSTDEASLKQCLTELYNAFKLQLNDKVLVQQVKDPNTKADLFFVICKAVAV